MPQSIIGNVVFKAHCIMEVNGCKNYRSQNPYTQMRSDTGLFSWANLETERKLCCSDCVAFAEPVQRPGAPAVSTREMRQIAAPGEDNNPPKRKGWMLAPARNREHVDRVRGIGCLSVDLLGGCWCAAGFSHLAYMCLQEPE